MTEEPERVDALGCGRQLRRTREKLGLSVDDVAGELRLSSFQIQALEEDDWSQLPGTTYARGYLRSYSRLLGLDADQLLAGASTQEIELTRGEPEIEAREPAEARETQADEPAPEAARGSSRGWVGVLVVAAVIAAGYWQYRQGWELLPGAGPGDAARHDEVAEREAEHDAAAQEANEQAATGSAATTSGAAEDDETGDSAPPTPTVPHKAVFQFNDRSWIDVRDARGERLLYRKFSPGRRVEIEGQPPFRVFLGNARAVQVEYMGDIVTPDTASGRLYARFVLGASSG